ncbi:MAG TPA: penicillin acylase family protein [Chloroflexia bacterium]|nr:penicillin acylase family protein [Chloroflexia bacterium]
MSRSRKGSRKSRGSRYGTPVDGKNDGYGRPAADPEVDEDVEEVEEATFRDKAASVAAPPPPRRRFTRKRILLGILALVVLLLGGVALWIYITIQKTLPTLNGTAQLKGLSAPVTVTRDVYGVPHIVAANVSDLYAAQGYVHAQDRLAQMFFFRAAGQGRQGELAGEGAVEADRFIRTVGFRRAAEAELAQMAPEVRTWLEAYTRGVNEFLHTHQDAMPLEFVLAGFKMEEWQPVDSVTFGKLQSWDLTDTWDDDMMASDLVASLGITRTRQLLSNTSSDGSFAIPGDNSGDLSPFLRMYNARVRPRLPDLGLKGLGSNNWAVSGKKSATGAPLLANDPHLTLRNPSPWYQVHLSTTDGKYDITGFGFAGAPGVVTGHNKDIAWGVTNSQVDVQDLFIEKLDPSAHPGQYLSGDKWVNLQVLTETIKVKDGEAVTQTVRLTNHGPLMTDITGITDTLGTSLTEPLALKWSASEPGHLIEALYALQTASNWEEFRAAVSKWDVPGQNFVYADKEGNIGYQLTGRVPVRKKGDGSVPVPGSTGEYDWTGYIPFDELPMAYNPPEGYVASANTRPFGSAYKYQVPGDWAPPWRMDRILEMLKAKEKLSVDDFKAMLSDTKSPLAKKVGALLSTLKPAGEREKQIAATFTGWDGDLAANSTPAAAYEFVMQRAISETFGDELGANLFEEYIVTTGNEAQRALENLLATPDDPLWDSTVTTATKETRNDILLFSLNAAVADMNATMGDNMQDWQWGKVHTVSPPHPFGTQALIGGIFSLPALPIGGDGTTVAVSGFPLLRSFSVNHHQSYRMIIDAGDWGRSLGIFATGESGQPFAKHWGDMFASWQSYQYNRLLYTPQDIEAQKEGVLTLNP